MALGTPDQASSPIGTTAAAAGQRRAAASAAYRAERARLEPYEAIARQVIELRARHQLTQEELAARVGTSHSQISRIESGQHRTTVDTLQRIADAFGVRLVVSFSPRDGDERTKPASAAIPA